MVGNKRNGSRGNGVLARLKADKKKSVVAACLIGVMVLMWVRVLSRKGPESASASIPTVVSDISTTASNLEKQISYVELPQVAGRNDALSRDFFASNGWAGFNMSGGNGSSVDVNVQSKHGDSQMVKQVASRLNLRSIVSGENRQAFINDKALSVGDRFVLKEGSKEYEFEVSNITDNQVFIKCGEAVITLKLAASITRED
jgi:hypothetical protein